MDAVAQARPASTDVGQTPTNAVDLGPVLRNGWMLTVPGEPVAKGRPRIGIVNGHAMNFTPAKTRSYEAEIRALASNAWGGVPPLDGVAIEITVGVYKAIPASWSQKKQAAARAGSLRPMTKPDWDNYGKSACDALNAIVFRDDALIVDAHVRKFYSDRPRMEIALAW